MRNIFDIDRFHEIREALSRNRSRSLLTGFGIFWGIFMLLFMMGGGSGMKDMLHGQLDGFATNSGFIVADETSVPYKGFRSGRTWSLDLDDVERIRRNVPELGIVTANLGLWGIQAVHEDRTASCQARGVLPDYADIEVPKLKYGRYINRVDMEQERKVCVIGKRIYRTLFPEGGDPCGKFLQVDGVYYRIVGVDFNNGNIGVNGSADQSVTIPMTVLQKVYNHGKTVELICMVARPGHRIKEVLPRVRELMAEAHYFAPDDKKALLELNMEEMFSIVDNLFKGVNLLIWLVGFGTLLAAAVGVSNIMMVTVRERTTEIGIRRAIGATPNMILGQIMQESVLLTLVFGLFGIVFSVFMLTGLEAVAVSDVPVRFQVGFWTAMLAVLILTVLGLLAGLAPALRAMHIKPVDAMRDE